MRILKKFRKFIDFLRDIRDRLVHIEEKVDGITVRWDNRFADSMELSVIQETRNPAVFYLAVAEGGGIGDAIMDSHLIKAIASMGNLPVKIDFYCHSYKQFSDYPFINEAYPYTSRIDRGKYDLVLTCHRFVIVSVMDAEKVAAFSPVLLKYCLDCKAIVNELMGNELSNYLFAKYALMRRKKRLEQCDINEILPYSAKSPRYMALAENKLDTLARFGLKNEPYMVINRAVDGKYSEDHPKLWPMKNYNELVQMIKANHDILVVQIGDSEAFGNIEGVDLNLIGQTTLEECKVILKNAVMLVSSEGGLVHMNYWLYGKSVVIFGPTLPEIFGYDSNINIRGDGCPEYCENLTKNWAEGCIMGYKNPPCICSVDTNTVYAAVARLLKINNNTSLKVSNICEYSIEALTDICTTVKMQKVCVIGCPERNLIEYLRLSVELSTFAEKKISEMSFDLGEDYGSIYNIPAEDETFDVIVHICFEKTPNYYYMIQEMKRVATCGGKLVLMIKRNCIPELIMALTELEIQIDKLIEMNDVNLLVTLEKGY